MKLKLETDGDITILAISEAVETKQMAILKAGLGKLFQSEKKIILLDFLAVPATSFEQDPALAAEISQLPKWAQDLGAQLSLVCSVNGANGLPNRQAAFEYLKNPLARLLAAENTLNVELRAAEQLKVEIDKKLQANAAEVTRVKALKNENTKLKRDISALEELIQRLLSKRVRPVEPVTSLKQKHENVRSLLITVLEQEGAIAPR